MFSKKHGYISQVSGYSAQECEMHLLENEPGSLLSEIQTPADGHPGVWTYEQDEINLKKFSFIMD